MKRLLTGWSLMAAACALGATSAAAKDSDFSTKETRALMHSYAKCVIKRQGRKASEALLADVDNATIVRDYKTLMISDCLARQDVLHMSFGGDLYRYALADALVNLELAHKPPFGAASLPPLGHREPGELPQKVALNGKKLSKKKYEEALRVYDQSLAYSFLARYGECIVRADTAGAKAVLLTSPDSREETAGFGILQPTLAQCLPAGQTLKFGRVALRGSIAINYYRLAYAVPTPAERAGG